MCGGTMRAIEEVKRALGRIGMHLNKARKRGKGVLYLEAREFSPHYEIKKKTNSSRYLD